jgi:hypothetical protein
LSATISRRWGSQIPFLIRRFSSPKQEELGTRIGIQHDGRLVFPNLLIADGKFHNFAQPAASSLPGACIREPSSRRRGVEDEETLSHAAYLAGVCVYVSDLLTALNAGPARPCVYAGSQGSASYAALARLAEAAGMPKQVLVPGKRRTTSAPDQNPHGYPFWVEAPPRQLYAYPASRGDRVFVSTTGLEAVALCAAGEWWSVWAPGTRTDAHPFPSFDDVTSYLADLQARDYETGGTGDPYDVLTDLADWYARTLNLDAPRLVESVRKVLSRPAEPGDSLVDLYCHLFQANHLYLDHQQFLQGARVSLGSSKAGIVIDDVAEEVYLSRSALVGLATRLKLPMPDMLSATDDLIARKYLRRLELHLEGWVVPKDYWEERAITWRSKTQP